MSDKVFSDSTFTATAERYVDSWNEFSTLNMTPYVHKESSGNSGFIKWLAEFFDGFGNILAYIVVLGLLILLAVVVYRHRDAIVQLFKRSHKGKQEGPSAPSASMNIFDHDYDHEIAGCLRDGQYSEAIRLVYLKTLYYLHRHNCITWNESKTATEYFYEYTNANRRQVFYEIISLYLVAVYGDNSECPVNEADYQRAKELNQIITKV